MRLTREMWVALIDEVRGSRVAAEAQLVEAEQTLAMLSRQVQELRDEEKSFRSAMARRFPDVAEQIDAPIEAANTGALGATVMLTGVGTLITSSSWTDLPRTTAVERAVTQIVQEAESASPAAIERVLHEHGRRDTRDEIGGATARLNKVGKIHSLGRGQWRPGPAPTAMTPGGTAVTVPPGSVTTERPGGDGHAAGNEEPQTTVPPDHSATFGGRDTRDHHRVEDSPVDIQF